MHFDQVPSELEAAKPILEKINEAGFEAYFVGGCVRDMILGQAIHDVDIASSAYPEEVKDIFEKTVDTGIQHGTVMVLDHGEGYEITTFRTESTYTDFRRPDSVTFVRSLSEDLKRRDFTINAFALSSNGDVIDHFDGLNDLKKKQIKAVGVARERFLEDALRMMRALRFASKLDFTIEDKTRAALKELAPNLEKIAVERIQVEFEKLLMGQAAGDALRDMVDVDLLGHMPGEKGMITAEHVSHLANLLDKKQPTTLPVAWLLYLGTASLSSEELSKELQGYKLSREIMGTVKRLAPIVQAPDKATVWDLYQVNDLSDSLLQALDILEVDEAVQTHVANTLRNLAIRSPRDLALNGGQLIKEGLATPGPALGNLLKQIEHAVVFNELDNNAEAIRAFTKEVE
ncbi:CCA tRNA nucleotidyltransferase [Fructobacillus sp. M2-14]|uniref:CCA-adding enzyme n=1 Tax=Fructobacillus broussonetiae TaxID=2713173 RepID=A0ABS5QYG5_9LACO|nr:CCA tRNA nucleotidyltransferase [Fructobacillus broussonetiae]MBS9338230.1 CCA tRNA nucleotidyltransferase [Fructobacillus broussonetiae]